MKSFCHIYAQFGQTAGHFADELEYLLSLGLSCDTDFLLGRAPGDLSALKNVLAAGGLVAPNIYPVDLDSTCRDPNWWKYSESECLRLMEVAKARFETLDLGAMTAVNTYTPGNGFVAACRRLGIQHILGFCAPIVIEDGGWSISHAGSPLSPYFISDEDFRKPENPGQRPDAVMMASMELRNPLVCLNHWSEGPWCPLNAQAADRWLEPGPEPLPFIQIAEDWLRHSELTGITRFFSVNLQFFFAGRCYDHNRRALEWLAKQRDKGRLEVGSLTGWAERMRKSAGFARQTTYWRGEMMGYHVGHRPGSFPDVVVDESLDRQVVWQYPDSIPKRLYDYQKLWSYPAFEPEGTLPESAVLEGITVTVKQQKNGDFRKRVEVGISNSGAARHVPLVLWDLLEECAGPFFAEVPEGWLAEVLPHPAGTTGAVLLTGTIASGQTHLEITIRFGARKPDSFRQRWGQLLEAQTFQSEMQPYTYLVAQTPEPFSVRVHAGGKEAIVESLCGLVHERRSLPPEGLSLQFDGTRLACWHRFWGLSAEELEISGVEEVETRLCRETTELAAAQKPHRKVEGYQRFGNIRDRSRWDRALARDSGDREMKRMNAWFREQRPDSGRTVIEVHPGIYLPRGSITKVLGHEFDVVHCEPECGFKELCVDYPQGWDWGVAAWVQWRNFRLQLDGLKNGIFTLHLHAFDPESRNISQRVHLFNPSASPSDISEIGVRAGWEICVVSDWDLPPTLEGRWEPKALCSVRIPRECLEWSAIGVWICPLEKMKLHDWVAEKGAPGLLSHLWVTKK